MHDGGAQHAVAVCCTRHLTTASMASYTPADPHATHHVVFDSLLTPGHGLVHPHRMPAVQWHCEDASHDGAHNLCRAKRSPRSSSERLPVVRWWHGTRHAVIQRRRLCRQDEWQCSRISKGLRAGNSRCFGEPTAKHHHPSSVPVAAQHSTCPSASCRAICRLAVGCLVFQLRR
jgi:hypothetical protein